jgi:putative membrane protein
MIPTFFQRINPFLPMSYVVTGMRQTISGGDMSTALTCALVLAAFGIGALAITTVAAWRRQTLTMSSLHPALSL